MKERPAPQQRRPITKKVFQVYTQSNPPAGVSATSATDRLVAMLNDSTEEPVTVTREQLAYLMSKAQGWGYDVGYEAGYEAGQRDELELASVAADYTYRGSFSAEATLRDIKRKNHRHEAAAAARLPRPNDFQGHTTTEAAA